MCVASIQYTFPIILSYLSQHLVERKKIFWAFVLHNLVPVTLGNFVGGGVFLGLVQWATYETHGYSPLGQVMDDVETAAGQPARLQGSLNRAAGGKAR